MILNENSDGLKMIFHVNLHFITFLQIERNVNFQFGKMDK